MASTFRIIQAGKAQMVLRIIFGQCLGQTKDEVFTTGTAYIGNKTYNFNYHRLAGQELQGTYPLDESYESEIGKPFSVQINDVSFNGESIMDNPNLHFTDYNTVVEMDNVYGIAYDCRT